jgi:soluble lytic murein transglycosylase
VDFAKAAGLAALIFAATDAAAAPSPRLKPAPPAPIYLTRSDLTLLRETETALTRRDWNTARKATAEIMAPIARSLGEWFYFYAEDPKVDFREAGAFLDLHPDWPALSKIQIHAEKHIPDNAPTRDVLDFFNSRDPLTGEGKLQLARAQYATGDNDAALIHLRDAWINHNFVFSDEQKLIANYGRRLTEQDHAARVDRLLWERQVTVARRVFARLDAGDRRMAEARAALLTRASNAPQLFDSLKDSERADSGVLLAAVRYFRRSDEEPRAVALAMQAPDDPAALRNPSRWWDERQLLMRWALTEGRYTDAYALAANHGLEPGLEFAEAEFNAGWIALRFLNAPDRAEVHFKALAGAVGAPISLARAYYWLGRAAEARGDAAFADARYRVAAGFIYTYYGQIAAEKLGDAPAAATFAPPVEPTPEDKARFSSRPAVAALRMLSELDEDQAFLVFAYHVDDQLQSPGEYVELARLAARKGATHIAVRAGKVGAGRNAFAAEVVYPLIFVPEEAKRFAPPEIILGLSRQESEFNPHAYSRAGARGLMQLLPSTAQITARKEGLRYSRASLLNDPEYNLIVGSAHLSHLFARYNGSRVMTFAAYNAGVSRVENWVERYGDPRAPDVDPLDWVEQIPFAETRNYVQRVLENTQVYRSRLTEGPIAGRLAADLELGGPGRRAGRLPNRSYAEPLPPMPPRTAIYASAAPLAQPAKPLLEPAPEAAPEESAPAATFEAVNTSQTRVDGGASELKAAPAPRETDRPALSEYLGSQREQKKSKGALSLEASPPEPAVETASLEPEAAEIMALSDLPDEHAEPIGAAAEDADCETYTTFIAATAGENASAADLNAGMLAELKSGAKGCEATAEDEPDAN